MNEWLNALVSAALNSIGTGNHITLLWLVVVTAITDIGIPLPFVLETVLFITAYQAGPFSGQVLLLVLTFLAGRQLGSASLYILSRILGNRLIRWLEKRSSKIHGRLIKFESRLNKWAFLGIMTTRLTPGLLQISSIGAGIVRVRYYHLLLGVTLASLVYDSVLVTLGFLASRGLNLIGVEFSIWVILGFLALIIISWVAYQLITRRKGRQTL